MSQVHNAESVASQVTDLADDLDDGIESAVDDGMDDTARQVQTNIKANDSVATGRLYLNAESERVTHSPKTVVARRISVPGVYKFVEYGTGLFSEKGYDSPDGPSPRMLENLQDWIEDKGITGDYYDEQRTDDGDPSPLAWAIASSIVEFGNRSHPFLRPAWYGSLHGRRHVKSEVESAINKAIRRS